MSKSYKLKNDNYIDSKSISYKKIALNKIIDIRDDTNFPMTSNVPNGAIVPLALNYSSSVPIKIGGTTYTANNTRVEGFCITSDSNAVNFELGCITFSENSSLRGKLIYRYKHGGIGSDVWTYV